MLTATETELLREIDRRPGVRVLVTMSETEAAGKRLVEMGLARRSRAAFVSIKPPQVQTAEKSR